MHMCFGGRVIIEDIVSYIDYIVVKQVGGQLAIKHGTASIIYQGVRRVDFFPLPALFARRWKQCEPQIYKGCMSLMCV